MMPQFISLKLTHNACKLIATLSASPLKTLGYFWIICTTLIIVSSLWSANLRAETVQRWQDSSGQWHFGDHAAAKGHVSKPVLVTTPISIIKNDQPADLKITSIKNIHSKTSKTRKKSSVTSILTRQNHRCDQLHQQLYDRTVRNKNTAKIQEITERYEHECIAGQYYGNQ